MRHARRLFLPQLFVMLILLVLAVPPMGAQEVDQPSESECPEGSVYDAVGDICVVPENLPPLAEVPPGDEPPPDEPVDEGESPAEGDVLDEPAFDDAPAIAGDPTATIKNLTLLTFACPINWNPATRPIESSREMCTEPIVPNMTYSILFEGEEVVVTSLGANIDLALIRQDDDGVTAPIPPGMWTIRENLQEGLEDPFASCAIHAADGSTRLTVMETVRGGSLDILLAAGEEVNCEWYSVATVPDVAAAPAVGLDLRLFSCPAPNEFDGGLNECTLPLPGPISFEFSYGGQVLETGTISPPEFTYDLDKVSPMSGEWTIRPILPEGWIDPHFTCTNGDITTGGSTSDATFFPPVDGSLGVTVLLNPDQRVQCQVWLLAGDSRESVVVVTRDCPENYNAATLSPGVRKATCPASQFFPVSITVDGAAPVEADSTRNGVAAFPTQPGTWRIQVDPQRGVGVRAVTFVTCDQTFAALGQVQTIEPTINSDQRSVSIDLEEGDALRCDFFFGPAAETATETGGTEADVAEPAAETEVETTEPEAAEPAAETDAEINEPEAADPEAGEAGMEPATGAGETDPADNAGTGVETDDPAPSGGSFGGGSTGAASDPADPGVAEDNTGESVIEGTSSLAIQHWDCPEPIAPEATVDDLIATCTASVQPSSWVVNGNPFAADDGYAVWDELPLESAVVINGAAEGKEDAASAVYCSLAVTDVDEPLIGVKVAVQDASIELVFDRPSVVYCNWFVAP